MAWLIFFKECISCCGCHNRKGLTKEATHVYSPAGLRMTEKTKEIAASGFSIETGSDIFNVLHWHWEASELFPFVYLSLFYLYDLLFEVCS